MATDPNEALDRIVREVLNVKDLVENRTGGLHDEIRDLRNTSLAQFDHIASTLGRLQSEYHALAAGVGRLERAVGTNDPEAARLAIREQLVELKKQLSELQRRVEDLEKAS